MEEIKYSSNAKLLLTGEYLVLKGAVAIAAPLKFRQHLKVIKGKSRKTGISWRSYKPYRELFFEAQFSLDEIGILNSNDKSRAKYIQLLLSFAKQLNPNFLPGDQSIEVEAGLDFDIDWGLGSSSTLISNIAKWAGINPFYLNNLVSRGSGYDIACADSTCPIKYKLRDSGPEFEAAGFHPDFTKNIYFAYTGIKQNTDLGISEFEAGRFYTDHDIEFISKISEDICECKELDDFERLIVRHEEKMSEILKIPSIKKLRFPDFPGAVKSLGAWGGDFILLTWQQDKQQLSEYLSKKNINIFFSYDDIVL